MMLKPGRAARMPPGPRWARTWARRLRQAQLRTRVLAGVLLITLVTLVAFDVVAVTELRGYLLAETDTQLQAVLKSNRALLLRASRVNPLPARQRHAVGPVHRAAVPSWTKGGPPRLLQLLPSILDTYFLEFISGRGPRAVIGGNRDLVTAPPPGSGTTAGFRTVTSANGRAQLRVLTARAYGGRVVVSASLAGVNKTVGRLQLIVTAGSAAAALLVLAGVGLVVRRGLRPIETMAAQADKLTAGDLTERVRPHDPATEVGRLGAALNGMLARIQEFIAEREASQEATRRFFADASHELRNPLASLRANAELYQQGALTERPQVDEAMRRIRLEAQRMSALVDDMLRLARLDQHPGQQHDPVQLSALVAECAERARLADPARTWRTHIRADLVTRGDEELLRRAIDNLLANVRAHTPRETVAAVTACRDGDTVTIEVTDNGPGVPAAQLPRIFDRFYRAQATSHRPGAGLGLAIVAATATAHHGTVKAAPNPPHGLTITLTLPATTPPAAANRPPAPAPAEIPEASGTA